MRGLIIRLWSQARYMYVCVCGINIFNQSNFYVRFGILKVHADDVNLQTVKLTV